MLPERWQRVEALLDAALDLPASERLDFLKAECADDTELFDKVWAMLAAGEDTNSMLDGKAVDVAASMLASGDLPLPDRVGPYRIERMIGEGGMGTVYLAQRDDGEFTQRVALKVIRRGLHLNERLVQRFRDERQILASLSHPGIARLLDGGLTSDGLPYFAMEYVEGLAIDEYCETHRLSVPQRIELFARVCDALAHAHEKQIVHRDIKPSNIVVSASGAPRLLDFGIAKLLAPDPDIGDLRTATRNSERLLTPEYASPEQLRGEAVVVATDVYCLGVLLYELLTGQLPFRRIMRSVHEFEHAVLDDDPTRPSEIVDREPLRRELRGDLDAIILTALRKEPERRFASAREMAADLRRHLTGQPIVARGTDPAYRTRRWLRRHRVAAGVGVVMAAITAIAVTTFMRSSNPRQWVLADAARIPVEPEIALDAEISPNGKQLAFVAGTGTTMHLYVRDLATNRVTSLGDTIPGFHRWPRWSPDGEHIALMSASRIYDVTLDGKSRLLVAPDSGASFAAFPAWSPDGKSLAYVQDTSIFVRNVSNSQTQRLSGVPRTPHSLRWSPNGKFIALVSGNLEFVAGTYPWTSILNVGNAGQSSVWVMPAAGGDTVRVSEAVGTTLNVAPAWLPDSRGLLYVSNRDGGRDVYRIALNEGGARVGDPQRITTGLQPHTISLSADGQQLGFSVFRLVSNIWSASVGERTTSSEPAPVTRGVQSIEGLSLSPDGKTLAFDSDRNGKHDIYTVPIAGGEPRQVTHDDFDKFMPSWSPDASEIAYHAFLITGARELRTIPAHGGTSTSITKTPINQRQPSWAPNGHALVFDAGRGTLGDVYTVERDTTGAWGAPHVIATRGVTGRWSPSGKDILYVRRDGIWVVDKDGKQSRQVLKVDVTDRLRLGNAEWSRDGAQIYFKRFDGDGRTSFWSVPAAGGLPRLHMQLGQELRSQRAEFATDGSRFFFTVAEHVSELWTASIRTTR